MKVVCTICGSDKVGIVQKVPKKKPNTKTMDEMLGTKSEPAVYKLTTWGCDECGYRVSG